MTRAAWNLSKFDIEDVFAMAVAVEQGGYDFYQKIIDGSDNPKVKNELAFLRDEEAQHKAFFQKLLSERNAQGRAIHREVRSLLEREFLGPMEEMYGSSQIHRNEEVLRFGIELEQKTIDLYEELKSQEGDEGFKRDLQTVIDEEKRHKSRLNIILAY